MFGRLYWADEAPPEILAGSYEILRALAVGTIGEVDLARAHGEAGFVKPVVVKRLRPELACQPRFRDALVHDTKLAVRLRAPGVVSVLDLGRDEDELYVTMEFVPGVSLAAWLDARAERGTGPLPGAVATFVVHQVLEALEAAHDVGLSHGELTARRVLVGLEGEIKVVGFGLTRCARWVETGADGPASIAEDLAAVGHLLHEMVSLRSLPDGRTSGTDVSAEVDVDAFLRQALGPERSVSPSSRVSSASRFGSAAAMRAALGAVLSEKMQEGRRTLVGALRADVARALDAAQRDLRDASREVDPRPDSDDGGSTLDLRRPRP